jgi:DNA-directed RNA polymerase subunit M/transcription elongation factor TFIIS
MEILDPAQEWQRLTEVYRSMSDDQLLDLAKQSSDLTSVAQQVLEHEISSRGMKMPEPEADPAGTPNIAADEGDSASQYADDRKLVEIATVWSSRDAAQLKQLLDTAGILFVLGPEKVTRVETMTSNFSDGVSVQTMKIAVPMARDVLKHYYPADQPFIEDEETERLATRCPKCHSEEVVFGNEAEPETLDDTPEKFEWSCDACGYKWEDDGVQTESS